MLFIKSRTIDFNNIASRLLNRILLIMKIEIEHIDCTCPNCGNKIPKKGFDHHLKKCPRTRDLVFPKYQMVTSNTRSEQFLKYSFLTASKAGHLFDSGIMNVEIGQFALEADFSLRPIYSEEFVLISEIADKLSAGK